MLKANPPAAIKTKIRELADKAGQPVIQFLNPFMAEIAEGRLRMVPETSEPKQAA